MKEKINKILRKITNWRKRKQLETLVKQEATNLRNNATSEEKANLNFSSLIPDWKDSCIYGQMTGNCYSFRAIALIKASCPHVYKSNNAGLDIEMADLNGSPMNEHRTDYWSPIELFIYDNRFAVNVQNNKRLIEYIKGETDELKFSYERKTK